MGADDRRLKAAALRDELAREVDVLPPVELDVGDGEPDRAGGANPADSGDAGGGGFEGEGDKLLDLVCA